ncbi:MAG: hypothetical protein H6564_00295 [Lewinellaceae bacterium]|nr:hypothetical protein [Lewinellaceae bacterium]
MYYEKTCIATLALWVLLWPGRPATAQSGLAFAPEEVAFAPVLPADAAPAARLQTVSSATGSPTGKEEKYAAVWGTIQTDGNESSIEAFYLDVYKLLPDGRRELARTGRQAGNTFRVYLERSFAHLIRIEVWEHEAAELEVPLSQLSGSESPLQLAVAVKKLTAMAPVMPPVLPDVTPASLPVLQQEPALPSPGLPAPIAVEPEAVSKTRITPDPWQHAFHLAESASLYYEMSAASKAVAQLSAGAEVEVLERTTPEWWLVSYRNKVGWIEVHALE